jgi:small subunit ribosomal protein S12
MVTIFQAISSLRKAKQKKITSIKLKKNPQKKAVCTRVLTISPKKPNSANRRVIKVFLPHFKTKLTAKIPGESHNIQQHSTILVRGARVRDLIAVSYSVIRGKYDLSGVFERKTKRSLYGVKKS